MITEKMKELQALKQKAAALETAVAEERRRVLAALPAEYGFDSTTAFLDAVLEAAGKRRGRRRKAGTAAAKKTPTGRKPRATITDETRAQVKKLVQGGKTGAEIADELAISLPTVQNIKKALGLVQKRK